ncbi:UNVERIFIED_CONTAM: hypothetical protein NCL1_56308 [Trichonephila clavipes]
MWTLQDALFICYKQSHDNAYSVAFSQRSSSPRLIEDETFNGSGIIKNLLDYEDGQEERDSLRVDKNMLGSSLSTNWKSIFKNKYQLRNENKIPKRAPIMYIWLSWHLQATNHPTFDQKLISYFMLPKNKSIEIVTSIDESAMLNLFFTGLWITMSSNELCMCILKTYPYIQ